MRSYFSLLKLSLSFIVGCTMTFHPFDFLFFIERSVTEIVYISLFVIFPAGFGLIFILFCIIYILILHKLFNQGDFPGKSAIVNPHYKYRTQKYLDRSCRILNLYHLKKPVFFYLILHKHIKK